jgi:DNA repair exonuclease SbcCD ATPase subunit
MDPVTAISLASSVVAFITFSVDLFKGAIEIHESLDGALDENRSREAIAAEMKRFTARLLPPDDARLSWEERGLCMLAAECRDLSDQLVKLLGRIKSKDSASKSQGLWSALKNKVHEKEKADLERRLDDCRSQLDLHLTFLTKTSLDALVESVKSDAAQLERLRENVEGLRRGTQVAAIGSEAQEQIRRLVDVQEDAFSAIIQDRILSSLKFEGMHGRFDMVDEAHSQTFRWLVEGGDDSDDIANHQADAPIDEGPQREMKRTARARFTSWLSSGEGIFHISGKLGSGKSTLMKYLSGHPKTRDKLTKWAGKRPLTITRMSTTAYHLQAVEIW